MRAARPWAYRVNYDREIAEDLKQIAIAERHIPLAAVLTEEERAQGEFHLPIVSFLFLNVGQRAPLLGLSATDIADLWWFCDLRDGYYGYTALEPDKGWYSRGEAIDKRLTEQYDLYVQRDPLLRIKKLRTRLSRHRRNKAKFG